MELTFFDYILLTRKIKIKYVLFFYITLMTSFKEKSKLWSYSGFWKA